MTNNEAYEILDSFRSKTERHLVKDGFDPRNNDVMNALDCAMSALAIQCGLDIVQDVFSGGNA